MLPGGRSFSSDITAIPKTVIPSGAGPRFFFPSRSCQMVGLRSEESLLEFATVEARLTLSCLKFSFVRPPSEAGPRDHRTSRLLTITRRTVMAVTVIHPGEHLAEELEALEMSAAELARKIAVPTNRVTQILNGTRSVTGDTALRLGHFFGTSPRFWLNLQTLYDVRIAEQKAGKLIRTLPRLKRKELVHT